MASTGITAMRVLVTRPREDCDRTAAALATRGHEAVVSPLFDVHRLSAELPGEVDAVLAASANAVRMAVAPVPAHLRRLPFFAVGSQTAAAAREAGFAYVRSADGDASALARLIRAGMEPGAVLLQLAGRPRRDEAITALSPQYRLVVAETYETRAATTLPEAAASEIREGRLDAVLHFSARAARIFGDLADKTGLLPQSKALLHVFISAAAVDSRFPRNRIADRPDLESVISAL
jgi:uroporphyrinogen-III synthase